MLVAKCYKEPIIRFVFCCVILERVQESEGLPLIKCCQKKGTICQAGVAQLVEHYPLHQSNEGQAHAWVARLIPLSGHVRKITN